MPTYQQFPQQPYMSPNGDFGDMSDEELMGMVHPTRGTPVRGRRLGAQPGERDVQQPFFSNLLSRNGG
jgi:hypothetical protein